MANPGVASTDDAPCPWDITPSASNAPTTHAGGTLRMVTVPRGYQANFEIRNEAAHASATRFRPSAARVKAYYGAICRFNLYASVVVENELSGDKLKAKEHRLFAGDLESLAKLLGLNPRPAGHTAQSRPDDSRKVAR